MLLISSEDLSTFVSCSCAFPSDITWGRISDGATISLKTVERGKSACNENGCGGGGSCSNSGVYSTISISFSSGDKNGDGGGKGWTLNVCGIVKTFDLIVEGSL